MIVTFRSNSHTDIIMFGDIAVNLLKMMGHSGTVPSALLAEDVPMALNRLRKAIEANKAATADVSDSVAADDDWSERTVSLAHRALPLIEMLEAAAKKKCNVMWDK